jgi:hypothetical protein
MKRFVCSVVLLVTGLLLASCGNVLNKGSSASPPTDVTVTPGDGAVTVTWTMAPNVQYWLFYAPTNFISEDNWTTIPGSKALINVTSPTIVTGLTNGTTYSFMINGRMNNGPGGADSPSLSAVPRLAGATWIAGTPLCGGACILNGETRGGVYVSVGNGGNMFSSPDGVVWTPLANPAPLVDLSAVTYGGNYVAVGIGGVTLFSPDAVNWTQHSGNTGNALTAVASNGAGTYVAVGTNGTIVFSTDGQNWTPANSIPVSTDLYGVAYGNGVWVAAGNGGTLLTSTDAANWATVSSNTTNALQGITYGANLYVAVGANGTIINSPDAVSWTVAPQVNVSLNAVTYGRQFVAVGASGGIFTSMDGTNWLSQTSGTSSNLNALAHAGNGYSAVGENGVNLTAN